MAMILTMAGSVILPARAASDGDLVKMDGYPAVYYLNGGKRYVFPNEKTYKTWYSDFSDVVTISQSEMETYPLGGNVTYRAGAKLVKIQTVPTVYAIEPNGTLRSILSEANAAVLYGTNWNKTIDDVPDAFFVNYTVGDDMEAGKYPTGTLAKETGSTTTYYIDGDEKRPIATGDAFDANNFNWSYLVTAASLSGYTDGASITGAETGLTTVSGTSSDESAGGNVTVALAASTPSATTIISDTVQTGQGLVPMVTVNFTAPASGDVTVTNLKYKRTGISADADVLDLYLYDGMTRLYQGGSLSSNYATFNSSVGLFTVPAGTTKAVTLKIDLNQNTSAGKTMGFELTEVTTKNDATVDGSLPLTGNLMTTASVTDMGYVNTTHGNVPTSAQTVNPGEEDFEIYKLGIQANDQDLQLEYLKLTLLGSIDVDDIENIEMTVSGTTLAAGTINSDRELIFDLTGNPYLIEKGQNKILSFRGDVAKGSTRNFRFSVEYSSDMVVKDKNYGVYVIPIGNGTADSTWSALKSSPSTCVYTINEGSLAISLDTSSPTENVAASATNIKLGTWKFEATGEDVKVKTLKVVSDTTGGAGLDNGKVMVNGEQVGSTTNLTEDIPISFSFGSSFIVPAGESVLVDVYADIKNTSGTNITSGTVRVSLDAASGNAQGQASLTSIDAPSSTNNGTVLTVSASTLTLTAYSAYGDQNMVIPAVGAKVASFIVQAGAYEGVTIDTINIDNATSGVMQNMKLMTESTQLGSTKATLTSTTETDNVFTVNLPLAANESKVIDVYADIKAGIDANSIDLDAGAVGTTAVTGSTVYHNNSSFGGDADVSTQTMTLTTGTITSAADGAKPDADIIIAGTSKVLMHAVKYTATNEAFTVTKMKIDQYGASASDSVGRVILEYKNKAGATVEKYTYLNSTSTADFTGLDVYVPKDGSATVKMYIDVPTISAGADSGDLPKLLYIYDQGFSATGESSNTVETDDSGAAHLSGNAMIVRKTKPTVTLVSLPSTVLTDGTKVISKFTITADAAGPVYFKELNWTYATTSGVDITDSTIYLYRSGQSTALNSADSLSGDASPSIEVALTTEEEIAAGSSQTYELKGTITGSQANRSFSTNLKESASAATAGTSTTYANLAVYETGGLLWSDGADTDRASDYADCHYVKSLPTDSQTMTQ